LYSYYIAASTKTLELEHSDVPVSLPLARDACATGPDASRAPKTLVNRSQIVPPAPKPRLSYEKLPAFGEQQRDEQTRTDIPGRHSTDQDSPAQDSSEQDSSATESEDDAPLDHSGETTEYDEDEDPLPMADHRGQLPPGHLAAPSQGYYQELDSHRGVESRTEPLSADEQAGDEDVGSKDGGQFLSIGEFSLTKRHRYNITLIP
jgi:hypothetical protein